MSHLFRSRVERAERVETRLFVKAFLAAALASFSFAAKADYLQMSDFGHKIKLQINGYTGSETLQNFPVLVRVSAIDGFQYSDMSDPTQGRDLAFFDANGNHLESEIDTWRDDKSKESLVWVKLPEMTQGTKFYICYNTSASGVYVTNNVPWGDYVGVWHLRETGNTDGVAIADSTTNHLDGVSRAGEGVNGNNGKIGRARRIATNNYHAPGIIVDATNGWQKTAADSLGTDFHASFWMSPQGASANARRWSHLVGRRKGDKGESWGVVIDDDAKGLRIYADKTQWTDNKQQRFVSTARDSTHGAPPPTITNDFPFVNAQGGWNKIDVLWKYKTAGDVACYEVYSNGVLAAAGALIGPVSDIPANIGIGCSTQDNYSNKDSGSTEQKGRRFNGSMDEVRLRPGVSSADWIKADFDTVDNANFVMVAPPEVTWVNDEGVTPGLSGVGVDTAVFSGTVTDCGGFSNCAIQCKVWPTSGSEPENWTTITNGLISSDAFSVTVSGLSGLTGYSYKLRAVGLAAR